MARRFYDMAPPSGHPRVGGVKHASRAHDQVAYEFAWEAQCRCTARRVRWPSPTLFKVGSYVPVGGH